MRTTEEAAFAAATGAAIRYTRLAREIETALDDLELAESADAARRASNRLVRAVAEVHSRCSDCIAFAGLAGLIPAEEVDPLHARFYRRMLHASGHMTAEGCTPQNVDTARLCSEAAQTWRATSETWMRFVGPTVRARLFSAA